ncbi:hypothetical protein PHYC_03713 [Phycisphaerales bacterium]|nr:hypothetical protein PHYC_03713 [Phycisphaerales bacterium]
MSRLAEHRGWLVLALATTCACISAGAFAQDSVRPDDAFETYLADRNLTSVLAAHFRQQLASGAPEERVAAAEALGKLYVKMLGESKDAARRQELEEQSRELLKIVPEAESFELRINLAKATYLQVEDMVERERLRLSNATERAEAARILRSVMPVFEELGAKLGRKVDQLEKREPSAREGEIELLRAELTDARRLRSLARYYAGWSQYYVALSETNAAAARRALEDFGVILNAVPGKPASVERLPAELLRYEHVSRAAIGCALCASFLNNDVEAARWLDAVESAENLPEEVQAQLFSRRLIVSAAAQHWADVELRVKRRRTPEPGEADKRLSIVEARLLAVLALDAARDSATRPGLRTVAERMGQAALADLVDQGEIGHVLDIVKLFGTAPIGDSGFIVAYVRGLQAYDKAREAHKAAGPPDEPTSDPGAANLYHQAADLLAGAISSDDSGRFAKESAKAGIRQGLALFFAGDFIAAGECFQAAADSSKDPLTRRDALWYAIVTLDRAVEQGRASQVPTRDRLATLFLQEYPGTENAAKLLLRQTRADRLSDAKAVEILLNVPKDSPMFESARRQAARMLYTMYKRAGASERDFAALRFAEIGEQVLKLEQARATAGDSQSKKAAEAVVLRVRQLADALLSASAPDVPRVEAAFAVLTAVENQHSLDLRQLEPELAFRRLQIAIARGDEPAARREMDRLRDSGGAFARAADRLMYRRALNRWKASPQETALARDAVAHGLRVLEELETAGAKPAEPSMIALRDAIADAAAAVFRAGAELHMRDLAIKLDRGQLEAGQRTGASLRRLGELLEHANDLPGAVSAWQELLVGTPDGSDAWYEARYHSLRLLIVIAPADAAAAMSQFRALHPDLGPAGWHEKFLELDLKLKDLGHSPSPAPPQGGGP